jgi:hypothetical protein
MSPGTAPPYERPKRLPSEGYSAACCCWRGTGPCSHRAERSSDSPSEMCLVLSRVPSLGHGNVNRSVSLGCPRSWRQSDTGRVPGQRPARRAGITARLTWHDVAVTGAEAESRCPRCGCPGVPLLFGRPIEAAEEAAAAGELVLAGCLRPEEPTNWSCVERHQWRDLSDERGWRIRLLRVLAAHGYVWQDYCDWCYEPLTEAGRHGSEAVGLHVEYACACERCLANHRYREPPDGWLGSRDEWPFLAA